MRWCYGPGVVCARGLSACELTVSWVHHDPARVGVDNALNEPRQVSGYAGLPQHPAEERVNACEFVLCANCAHL